MLRNLLLLASVTCLSFNVHAGFFKSSEEFKCGRDDAVKALQDHIKNDAMGGMQKAHLTLIKFFHNPNLAIYQDQVNNIKITVSNVSTTKNEEGQLFCTANIAMSLPNETLDVIRDNPTHLSQLTKNQGFLNNNNIVWNDFGYKIKLADNKKDISVNHVDAIATSMIKSAIMAIDKDEIIKENYNDKLSHAKSEYTRNDAYLNQIWKNFPDSIKSSMKNSQASWIDEKAVKCGKLADANSDATALPDRLKIYECQLKMTMERLSYLRGVN